MMREKYESLSAAALKEIAKARGLKNISALKKSQVVERMLEEDAKEEALAKDAQAGKAHAAKDETSRYAKSRVSREVHPREKGRVSRRVKRGARLSAKDEMSRRMRAGARLSAKGEMNRRARAGTRRPVKRAARISLTSIGTIRTKRMTERRLCRIVRRQRQCTCRRRTGPRRTWRSWTAA